MIITSKSRFDYHTRATVNEDKPTHGAASSIPPCIGAGAPIATIQATKPIFAVLSPSFLIMLSSRSAAMRSRFVTSSPR